MDLMRACDSLGHLKLKQGVPSISDSSQEDSTVKLCLDFLFFKTRPSTSLLTNATQKAQHIAIPGAEQAEKQAMQTRERK